MKLSAKQIALFGQVTVELRHIESKISDRITLLELYKQGWWATMITGTLITLVRPKEYAKDGFACVVRRIYTDVNLDSLDREIKLIADYQYEKYKHKLLEKQVYNRIKRVKLDD